MMVSNHAAKKAARILGEKYSAARRTTTKRSAISKPRVFTHAVVASTRPRCLAVMVHFARQSIKDGGHVFIYNSSLIQEDLFPSKTITTIRDLSTLKVLLGQHLGESIEIFIEVAQPPEVVTQVREIAEQHSRESGKQPISVFAGSVQSLRPFRPLLNEDAIDTFTFYGRGGKTTLAFAKEIELLWGMQSSPERELLRFIQDSAVIYSRRTARLFEPERVRGKTMAQELRRP